MLNMMWPLNCSYHFPKFFQMDILGTFVSISQGKGSLSLIRAYFFEIQFSQLLQISL